jgi:hypothetical protein
VIGYLATISEAGGFRNGIVLVMWRRVAGRLRRRRLSWYKWRYSLFKSYYSHFIKFCKFGLSVRVSWIHKPLFHCKTDAYSVLA